MWVYLNFKSVVHCGRNKRKGIVQKWFLYGELDFGFLYFFCPKYFRGLKNASIFPNQKLPIKNSLHFNFYVLVIPFLLKLSTLIQLPQFVPKPINHRISILNENGFIG
jgi:hypothetical protein